MLCVAVGFAPSFAFADWTAFIPRPFENGSFFDTFASFERDNIRSGTTPARWTDTFIRERLTLYSNGYSYHPRFLQYQFSLAGTGRQEDYDLSSQKSLGWRQGNGVEYDAGLFLLPEHSYNLHLFARRYEPLYKEQSATQHSSIETSRGAAFRYRKKPYFLHVNYVDDTIESGDSSSDVTRVGLSGEYFKRYTSGNELSFTAGFNPSWFSGAQGLGGSSTEYLLGNFLNLRRVPAWAVPVRLNSDLSKNSFEQESSSFGKFQNDQFVWYEILTADLPLNLRSDLSYRYQDNESTIPNAGTTPSRTLSDTGKDLHLDVVHRLYQSLDTTYTFLDGSRTSSGGETTALSHSLVLDYSKSIPRGRFMAGINLARSETDNRGRVDVVNEPHEAINLPIPGSFILNQPNVEPASISVYLRCASGDSSSKRCPSRYAPGETVPLYQDTNYRVRLVGNNIEIYEIALPPEFDPGAYDFLVSYSVAGDFGLRADMFGGNVSADLFDNLLTPYFSYGTVSSKVLSGVFPGTPVDSTTYTTGLLVHVGPVRMRGEYQDLQWELSPYQAWRAEVQYVGALNPTTSVYATAAYLNKHYPRGTSVQSTAAYTEETESASGTIQKQLFSRDLFVSAGGSYSRMQGLVDANAYSLSASLTWKIGKVDLSIGVSAYETDTAGTTTLALRRDHELATVNLRRRLF
jgi:hypothetical protein